MVYAACNGGKLPEVLFDIDEADRPPVEAGDMETICQPIDFLGVISTRDYTILRPRERCIVFRASSSRSINRYWLGNLSKSAL